MTRRLALLLGLVIVASACIPPQVTPSPSASASAEASASPLGTPRATGVVDMSQALLTKPLPEADIFALTREMRGRDGVPAQELQPVRTTPPDEGVGTTRQFWVYDFAAKKNNRVSATIRMITDHAKWWVQDDISVDMNGLQQTATFFETNIYPTDRRIYGSEWNPGIDGDPRISALVVRLPGAAAGYFNSSDEMPLWVNQFSAEREMIYLSASSPARLGTAVFNSYVAHEFCHMIQFARGRRSSTWFNEGQAQLCEVANGFPAAHTQTFLRLPDTQLNDWPDIEQSQPYYGESHLFLEFLREHAGGEALINAFMDKGIDTPSQLDEVLRARGQKPLEELFADFVAANAFIGTTTVDSAVSYTAPISGRDPAGPTAQDRPAVGAKVSSSVHNYAVRYFELPRGSVSVRFKGATSTRLLPTDPHSGNALWWSDRNDSLDSRLTREVDLSKATSPTLSFWTWYNIEKDYDYGYVAVSTDGGHHWTTLASQSTTKDDPNGQNLGNGYTGASGGREKPVWTKETVDLSAYAGKTVQLRFEYVTDPGTTLDGFAIDDITIPGVLNDDAEADNGWTASGFVRSSNVVSQRYVVQLLRFTDKGATVERRVVDSSGPDAGAVTIDVDTSQDRRPPLLAVTGFAVRTTQPATFDLAVDKR